MTNPEDVGPKEIWNSMDSDARYWLKKKLKSLKKDYPTELIRVKIWQEMNEWYEEEYEKYQREYGEYLQEVFDR